MRDATELEANGVNDYVNRISVDTGVNFHNRRGERGMIAQVPTEVIPVWFIEKWGKENAETGSALDHFLKTMIKDWYVEEIRQKTEVTG